MAYQGCFDRTCEAKPVWGLRHMEFDSVQNVACADHLDAAIRDVIERCIPTNGSRRAILRAKRTAVMVNARED